VQNLELDLNQVTSDGKTVMLNTPVFQRLEDLGIHSDYKWLRPLEAV